MKQKRQIFAAVRVYGINYIHFSSFHNSHAARSFCFSIHVICKLSVESTVCTILVVYVHFFVCPAVVFCWLPRCLGRSFHCFFSGFQLMWLLLLLFFFKFSVRFFPF